MRMYDIIARKRDKKTLSGEELSFFIDGIVKGSIPDYQTTALLMAIYLNGMDGTETAMLCKLMAESGDTMSFSKDLATVDKHSTGGVGDKTSLITAPIAAASGLTVAKMSGRALGHTGGTVDKLESIPGMKMDLDLGTFEKAYRKTGLCISGQSGNMVPADKILYGLRDVTATVGSIPLIATSIMSKKLAAGAKNIVLDVKTGAGAFMEDEGDAFELAKTMVGIGIANDRNISALVTRMDAPLGYCIGNSLEVREAVDVLKGKLKGTDLYDVSVALASELISMGKGIPVKQAMEIAESRIQDGSALGKLREMIIEQGGEPEVLNDYSLFKQPARIIEIKAKSSGYVKRMDAGKIGIVSMKLGAGRIKKGDPVDSSAGVRLVVKPGDKVGKGDVIAYLHTDKTDTGEIEHEFENALEYSKEQPMKAKVISGRVAKEGKEKY